MKEQLTQRTQRTQKLLIMVGEEGTQFQGRDFKKLSEVVVETYLADNDTDKNAYQQFLAEMLCRVIREVPLKQHIYAGLTSQIRKWNKGLGTKIIEMSIKQLQQQLSSLHLHPCVNIITYFAELMNISLLNSLTFFNIIDDIVNCIENQSRAATRDCLVSILVRCLPIFAYSLHEKMYHDFKKLIERMKKYCSDMLLFQHIYEKQQKGTHENHSQMPRLQYTFQDVQQYQTNIKLNIKVQQNAVFVPVQYYQLSNEDKLYDQYVRSEGVYHKYNIENLVESFYGSKEILTQKLNTYITNYRSSFMIRLMIETLISKALKNQQYIVEASLLLSLGKNDEDVWSSVQNFMHTLFNMAENFTFDLLMHFAKILSFLINNCDGKWDWEKILENQESFLKRKVLLQLIFQKQMLINDKFKVTENAQKYMPPETLTNETKYHKIQEMEVYENFVDLLKRKCDSEQVMVSIDSEESYQIFLQALFEKTSLSRTHLNILMQRYKGIFEKYKTQYDWTLITKIREFWKSSLYHRMSYLSFIIEQEFCTYDSYVKYVGKLKPENKEEDIWIKIELNQLNKKYGKHLK